MDQELTWFANASAIDANAFIAVGISEFSNTQNVKFEQRERSKKQLEFAFTSGRISAADKQKYDTAQATFEEQCRLADTHNDVLIILAVLGSRIVRLGVVNHSQITAANSVVRQALQNVSSSMFFGHYEQLARSVQIGVVVGMVFCAECYPMHIWRGFATGVRADWENYTPWTKHEVYDTLDRSIAFLKSAPRNFALLKKLPEGMDRFQPWDREKEKSQNEKVWKEGKKDRKILEETKKDFNKRVEKKGFPQPIDKSFTIASWSLPFATWDSQFVVNNEVHSWMNILRHQMDPGRLLHAFVIGGHLMLREGEVMIIPAGPAECLVHWLEGLDGITFKLIPESKLDFKKLGLKSSTKKSMKNMRLQDAYAVRDAAAVARNNEQSFAQPAPMPPMSSGVAHPAPKMPWERKEPSASFNTPQTPTFTPVSPSREFPSPPPQYVHAKPQSPLTPLAGTQPAMPEMDAESGPRTDSPKQSDEKVHTEPRPAPTTEQAGQSMPKMPSLDDNQPSPVPIDESNKSGPEDSARVTTKLPSRESDLPSSYPIAGNSTSNAQYSTHDIPNMPSMNEDSRPPQGAYNTPPLMPGSPNSTSTMPESFPQYFPAVPKMPSMEKGTPSPQHLHGHLNTPPHSPITPNPQYPTHNIPKMPSMEDEVPSPYTTQGTYFYSGDMISNPIQLVDRRSMSFPTVTMNADHAGLDRRSSMMGSIRRKAVGP